MSTYRRTRVEIRLRCGGKLLLVIFSSLSSSKIIFKIALKILCSYAHELIVGIFIFIYFISPNSGSEREYRLTQIYTVVLLMIADTGMVSKPTSQVA